jgi:hypothetical protein
MPLSPSLPRRAKTGRSGCVPELRIISDSSSSFTFCLYLQKELKKLAKVQGSAVPLSAGTPVPSTPATASVPTQPPAPPPRTSTPTPVPRGIKREFEDSSLAQPNAQGPGSVSATVSNSRSVSPTSGQVQRPSAAKAGVPGARPRPVKKQRVVSYDSPDSKLRRVWGRGHAVGSRLHVIPSDCCAYFRLVPLFHGNLHAQDFVLLTFFACHQQDIQGQARDMHPHPPIQQPTPQGV